MSKILITGANGFIGANIVRAALVKGYEVKAFVRQTSNLQTIQDLPIDFAYGDLREIESIHKALDDCNYIIHNGAIYLFLANPTLSVWWLMPRPWETFKRCSRRDGVLSEFIQDRMMRQLYPSLLVNWFSL